MKRMLKMFAGLLLACAMHGAAAVATYDAAADFSATNNPNGVWSYGYTSTLGSAFVPFSQTLVLNGVQFQLFNLGSSTPSVGFNPTGAAINFVSTTWLPHETTLHPGPGNQLGVIRFTAPTAGSYSLTSNFNMRSAGGTQSTDVHVLKNNVSAFDAIVSGFNQSKSFDSVISLAAGDKLDFVVGSNGNFSGDTTQVRAHLVLTAVPEPLTSAMFAAGLGLLAMTARRRCQVTRYGGVLRT